MPSGYNQQKVMIAHELYKSSLPLTVTELQDKLGFRPTKYALDSLIREEKACVVFLSKYGKMAYLGIDAYTPKNKLSEKNKKTKNDFLNNFLNQYKDILIK